MRKVTSLLIVPALVVTGLVFQPAATAQAKAHLVQTIKADIDGDGRRDSVRVDRLHTSSKYRTTFKVTVKTAKGKTASRTLTVRGSAEYGRITRPLVAAADVDGARGSEIVLRTVVLQDTFMGSRTRYAVLTWRNGKLVKELPATGAWLVGGYVGEAFANGTSLVFDTVDGVKYALTCTASEVDRHDAGGKPYREYWHQLVSSAWRDGKWQSPITSAATSVADPRCEPHSGATLVLQAS